MKLSTMHKELILIRHAQSEWQSGITNDRNSNLTEKGVLESKLLYMRLKKYIEMNSYSLYCSTLNRAMQTCNLSLSEENFSRVTFNENFNEANFHVRSSIFIRRDFFPKKTDKKPSEYMDFKHRISMEITDILARENKVVIYTHGGVIKTILRIFCGSDEFCSEIENCSITHFIESEVGWILKKVNYL
ncbi:histidine phosphatase family protein [Photorhabdus hindustanensis]|uniref:Histidine phosphatase family protein n=1 Tax=Photorhabdus hindustanensis TaxID=2918802 RepID=A0A2S8Q887_9GAMM|nr:histidine phosphatase family protein [Photorhabdus hindustanensis]PQQ29128.1 hypothetical protein C6H66_02275 [Photorhabdus hindustanensis]